MKRLRLGSLVLLLCAAGRSDASTLTFIFENDKLNGGSDDNYTSGVGVSWVADEAGSYGEKRFVRKVAGALSFLPAMGKDGYRDFVSFTLGQEMYTPTDIQAEVPPPDQQPYAGVLFFDTGAYAHRERSMHASTVRVGCVGPCSGAEQTQRQIHRWVGAPIPQGWAYQLHDELLLNLDYQYHRRLLRRSDEGKPQYDVAATGGAAVGNYFTGANVGIVARFGTALPDSFGSPSLRTGGAARFVGIAPPPGRRWQAYAFLGAHGYGIARFLPTDGNTGVDGPSVARDDLVGNVVLGFVVGRGRLQFSFSSHALTGFEALPDARSQDFATLTLSYYLP